CMQGTHLPYSF
nr:immunoglobulin light chain junction region [Macaca mulatta]MOV78935.1 immunoglobulin light chain junction region [Macaca mulatta]MOV79201.1 immunoglobulin light chain junction region [Macaca mulatta]MOV80154.1 immunoglobulin light chain junction region [Macaca mulatta]MOV80407.1 immunoglobulin light chain junction region [Macaca mulatta]